MFVRKDIISERAKQHGVNEAFLRAKVHDYKLYRPTRQEINRAIDLILAKAWRSESGYEAMFEGVVADKEQNEYTEIFERCLI